MDTWDLGAAFTLVGPAPAEPITVAEVKGHLRINPGQTFEDALIGTYIAAARSRFEAVTGRQIIRADFDLYLDRFPLGRTPLTVRKTPLVSVSAIKWYDTADVETTIAPADYLVDTVREPGRILLRGAASWPTGLREVQGARIRLTAGAVVDVAAVDGAVKRVLYDLVAAYYRRGGQDPAEVDAWLAPFTLVSLA